VLTASNCGGGNGGLCKTAKESLPSRTAATSLSDATIGAGAGRAASLPFPVPPSAPPVSGPITKAFDTANKFFKLCNPLALQSLERSRKYQPINARGSPAARWSSRRDREAHRV
jgi:hypothetical protein